jgi:hypothetical protein
MKCFYAEVGQDQGKTDFYKLEYSKGERTMEREHIPPSLVVSNLNCINAGLKYYGKGFHVGVVGRDG